MKTLRLTFSTNSYKSKPLLQCQENLRLLLSRLRLSWRDFLLLVISSVSPVPLAGQAVYAAVEIASNTRHLVGGVMLLGGAVAIFFHHLFFDESLRDLSWHYINNYYFYWTLRPYIVLLFWSIGFILFSPGKWKLAIIPFSLANAVGWYGVFYYGFFVETNLQHHQFAPWSVFVIAISYGVGFTMSFHYLLYRYNHITRNNHSSFVGVTEMAGKSWEEKGAFYMKLRDDFRNKHSRV